MSLEFEGFPPFNPEVPAARPNLPAFFFFRLLPTAGLFVDPRFGEVQVRLTPPPLATQATSPRVSYVAPSCPAPLRKALPKKHTFPRGRREVFKPDDTSLFPLVPFIVEP